MTVTNDFFNRLDGVWQNKLDGEWKDSFGWNFISQPKLGEPERNDFGMRVDQMRETITFKKLGGLARNIGITGEAGFWQATAYEVSIETPDGEGIHHEMGHFLLGVKDASGETREELRGDVVRQASIPRANVMMTAGIIKPDSIQDTINEQVTPFYGAKPQSSDAALQALIDAEFAIKQSEVIGAGGPDLERPLDWLTTILATDPDGPDWVLGFRKDANPSQMANGQRVVSPVSIGNLLSDFWIARRQIGGNTIDILQYAQIVNLGFGGVNWPHVAFNTLIKQP